MKRRTGILCHRLYLLLNISLSNVSNIHTAEMVRRFRVDGIPHLAFIGSNQEVKTALVGSIPKTVLKDEIVALLQVSQQSAIIRLCYVVFGNHCID
jgi:hypothetical protein